VAGRSTIQVDTCPEKVERGGARQRIRDRCWAAACLVLRWSATALERRRRLRGKVGLDGSIAYRRARLQWGGAIADVLFCHNAMSTIYSSLIRVAAGSISLAEIEHGRVAHAGSILWVNVRPETTPVEAAYRLNVHWVLCSLERVLLLLPLLDLPVARRVSSRWHRYYCRTVEENMGNTLHLAKQYFPQRPWPSI